MSGGDQEQGGLTPEKRVGRAKVAAAARWGGRGESRLIRVDPEAADALLSIPTLLRRSVASMAIINAAQQYLHPKQS